LNGGTAYTVPLNEPFWLLVKFNCNAISFKKPEYWIDHNNAL